MTNVFKRNEIKFYVLVTIGSVFAAIGLFCPPIGQIDNSVLILVGEFIVLAGGIVGVDLHFNIKELVMKSSAKEDENNE